MNSEQLLLELRMPWNGYDPRSLTDAFQRFSLIREGTGRVNLEPILATQLELFPEGTPYGTS